MSRATPTVAGDKLIVTVYGPAYVVALKLETGELLWMQQLDKHPAAAITMSGTYYKGGFFVGTSLFQKSFRIENCCTFRGSFVRLDAKTGAITWQTFMVPENDGQQGGYAGGAVLGRSPSIDTCRNHIYIATGILDSAPQPVQDCQNAQNNQTFPSHPDNCTDPDDHTNSILALDIASGEIRWYRQLGGYNVWLHACTNSPPACPSRPTPYAEFGEVPMIFSRHVNGVEHDVVAAVQKSGFVWTLDRDNGDIVWFTVTQFLHRIINDTYLFKLQSPLSSFKIAGSRALKFQWRRNLGSSNGQEKGLHKHRQWERSELHIVAIGQRHKRRRLGGNGRNDGEDNMVDGGSTQRYVESCNGGQRCSLRWLDVSNGACIRDRRRERGNTLVVRDGGVCLWWLLCEQRLCLRRKWLRRELRSFESVVHCQNFEVFLLCLIKTWMRLQQQSGNVIKKTLFHSK
ncbi:uncharacterized protein LOC127258077 [Andrographis paniculata]|uniref:uncharacterized protein LOC127258077 n=1 Tax=Andrographis paniculata TaxID=175694 RepID=UPI0021E6ECED|nr:uncharacterized protein LOC127258077 [Andrographis paniculata]